MPQRFLRPGITTSIRFNALDWQAQSFYVRLLTLVDDFGRYEADFRLLRSHVFPLGDKKGTDVPLQTVENICKQMSVTGLVLFYENSEAKKYLQVLRWQERPRAQTSRYPEFLEDCKQMFGECEQMLASLVPRSSPLHHRSSPDALRYPADAGDEFKTVFEKWIEFRKGLGKKPKNWDILFQEQIDWLATQPRRHRCEIVSQSIRNGWQGLFELKHSKNGARADTPSKLDPSKIAVPTEFKTWGAKEYPKQSEAILGYKMWSDVPDWMRTEWKRKEVDPLSEKFTNAS